MQLLLAGNNVNDGFGFAFRIIQEFKLDSSFIYSQAAHFFAKQHKYNSIRQLLSCIKDSGLSTDQSFDEVIGASIRVIAAEPSEVGSVFNAYVLAVANWSCFVTLLVSFLEQLNSLLLSGVFVTTHHHCQSLFTFQSKEAESLIKMIKSDDNKASFRASPKLRWWLILLTKSI